jgi:tRNA-specific 2-thiouridylase
MKSMTKDDMVYVALSGGVDSAVTAALLLSEGYQVTGIHMETWKDPTLVLESDNSLSSKKLAEQTAQTLGFPFISINLEEQFFSEVVQPFIKDYHTGLTPNPCLFCNPQIKWGVLQSYALEKGGKYFATGHYAKLVRTSEGSVRLFRAVDQKKDQSYVLSLLSQYQLQHTLLPLGELTKEDVRKLALELNLPVADREDSQDLCFLGSGGYREFLYRYSSEIIEPGEIVNLQGEVIGRHEGLAFYTIGQRKGIRVASSEPYFVIDKDVETNRLIVGFEAETGQQQLIGKSPNWISGNPPEFGELFNVMIRYRAKPIRAELNHLTEEYFGLKFNQKIKGITPGQVAVLYKDQECLGGGVIQTCA